MAFRKTRREKTGKNSWRNYGKSGFSTTTKIGSRTVTQGPKGIKSTYRYADGLSQNSYIGKKTNRKGGGKKGFGDAEVILVAIVLLASLAFAYPLIAALIAIVCILGATLWWTIRETNSAPTVVEKNQPVEATDNEEAIIDDNDVELAGRPWYQVLSVSPQTSSLDEIKAARDNLAKIYHSDRLRSENAGVVNLADQKLAEVNAAYQEALKYCNRSKRAASKNSEQREAQAQHPEFREFNFGNESDRADLDNLVAEALEHDEPLGHILLVGGPETFATKVAQIIARDLNVNCRKTSGALIKAAGDLAALLTNLEPRDVLFINEIHRLSPQVEEILDPAMEEFQLDLIIGEGSAARSVKIDLSPFTVIGAIAFEDQISDEVRKHFALRLNLHP